MIFQDWKVYVNFQFVTAKYGVRFNCSNAFRKENGKWMCTNLISRFKKSNRVFTEFSFLTGAKEQDSVNCGKLIQINRLY